MSRFRKKNNFNFNNNNDLKFVLLLLAIAAFVFFQVVFKREQAEVVDLPYSMFVDLASRGNIKSVMITDGINAQGELVDGKAFKAEILPSQDLWKTLQDKKVKVTVKHSDKTQWGGGNFMLIFLLMSFGLALLFYFRKMGGGGGNGGAGRIFSMGKSKARFFSPHSIKTTFKDVAGVEEAKEDLQDVVNFLSNPEKFERLGAKIPQGVLLCGAPGNGKTLLAKAVAGEASCPFLSISGSDFVEVFVGVGASRVRDLFTQARKHAPCIVFIDEIDAVGRQRGASYGGGHDEREQTLNQLLAEMDGFATKRGNVIVIAATNRPDVLDKALLRPGRFDRSVEVPYPDLKSRLRILEVHAKKVPLNSDVSLSEIARSTPGFSGADLENLINEAALNAAKHNKELIGDKDFSFAQDKLILGSERKTMIMTEEDRRLTAYHEGGHTMLNLLLPSTDPFHKVTIIPRGRALGVTTSMPDRDKHNETKQGLLDRIKVCLGGMIVEKQVFGEETTGASSDISKATQVARQMVCDYGMSSLGPIRFDTGKRNSYLGAHQAGSESYSADTARRIDEEVEKIVRHCFEEAEALLLKNRDKLDTLAEELLVKETLNAAEVYELLGMEPRKLYQFKPGSGDETPSDDAHTLLESEALLSREENDAVSGE